MADKQEHLELLPGKSVNKFKQHITLLTRLKNPVKLRFIGLRPTATYIGKETQNEYVAGGSIKALWVDGRDVESLLSMRYGRDVLFAREKAVLPPVIDNPAPEDDRELAEYDEEATFTALVSINGIGEATARKLAEARFTPELLAAVDESQFDEVAKRADISKGMAARAIEGAKEWQTAKNAAAAATADTPPASPTE